MFDCTDIQCIVHKSSEIQKKGSIFCNNFFEVTIGKNYLSCVKKNLKNDSSRDLWDFYAFIEISNNRKEDFGNRNSHDQRIDKFEGKKAKVYWT